MQLTNLHSSIAAVTSMMSFLHSSVSGRANAAEARRRKIVAVPSDSGKQR